jgi:hypothetical protein
MIMTLIVHSISSGTTGNGNFSHGSSLTSAKGEEADDEEKWEFDGPIRKCSHVNNNALNKCLKLILSDLKPRIANGVPEINLPPMDPLHLKNVAFRHGSGAIKINAVFSNVEAMGLSRYNKSDLM